ncbi:MAG: glycosyltransferase [Bacteroidetes bacterium]|nr:glycosyltransferase [Bacteroidota bacterium]MCW5894632.1 glycosyltransferase [Bacteroidota bacterium]
MNTESRIKPHIAIVHEWLTGMRGGEKCVEALCEVFPGATVFTLVHVKGSVSPTIEAMPIRTSFIQHLPFAQKRYRHYLPLFPTAIERLDLSEFDIVISSNHAVAKGVRTKPETLHICYCHTPMRYIWNLYDEYFGKNSSRLLTRAGMKLFVNYLRKWDVRTATNPHFFIANSRNVQQRINRIYRREADVIYPPVDTSLFQLSEIRGDYFLIVSAFVPYKRLDLAIEAFNRTGEKLVIIGSGPDDEKLRSMAKPNIEFPGWQPDDVLRKHYAECKALVFPGEEDFGIVPLEAMASGKPVIAYAKGGALETVIASSELRTGVLFHDQSVESLVEAIHKLNTVHFSPLMLRRHALSFDREIYKKKMREYILDRWNSFKPESRQP